MSRPLLIVLIAWGVGLSGWIFLSQGGTTGQQPAQLYDGWSNQLVSPAGMLPPNSIPSITTVQSSGVRTNSPSPSSQPSFMVTTTPTPNHTNPPIVTPLPTTPRTPTPNPTIIITPTPTPVFSVVPTQIPQITQIPTPTLTTIATPISTTQNGHIYYTSHLDRSNVKYYYCDTDSGWKGLTSPLSFNSEATLLEKFPNRKLHEVCK